MATKIHNVQQRTPEWHDLRLGKLTASRFKEILDMRTYKLKSKDVVLGAVSRLLAEEETGFSTDSDYMSDAMEWGLDCEKEYKEKYLDHNGFDDVGFATNDLYPLVGCSPDSLHTTGQYAVEIKALNSANHIKICLKDEIPKEYLPQIYIYFIVFQDLQVLQFVSYDPRNQKRPVFKKEVRRGDIDELHQIKECIVEFTKLVDQYRIK